MIEWLNNIDIELMVFLNSFNNEYFDHVFWMISGKLTWIPLYLTVIAILFRKNRKQAIYLLLLTAVLILLADQISSGIIKPLVHRLRPSHTPAIEEILHYVNGYRGGPFGFVSSHAANTVAFAGFFSLVFGNRTFTVISILWALLVSYSRIYLGVHFPGDILGGLAVGVFAAFVTYFIYRKFSRHKRVDGCCEQPFSGSDINVATAVLLANTGIIFIISAFL